MCLTKLTTEKVPNSGYGYKVFMLPVGEYDNTYLSPICCGKRYVLNKRYTSTSFRLLTREYEEYKSGFHILLTKEDAEKYLRSIKNFFSSKQLLGVKKVYYKGVVAVGEQDGLKCIVTTYMTIKKS